MSDNLMPTSISYADEFKFQMTFHPSFTSHLWLLDNHIMMKPWALNSMSDYTLPELKYKDFVHVGWARNHSQGLLVIHQ